MSRAGRKRKEGIREPNGRLKRETRQAAKATAKDMGGVSPGQIKRLRDMALAGVRDSIWGTVLGQLFLTNAITASQFEAGKRWANLHRLYLRAIECRTVKTGYLPVASEVVMEPENSRRLRDSMDMDESVEDRALRHMEAYDGALKVFRTYAHPDAEGVTRALCEGNGMTPASGVEMLMALHGLQLLANHWNIDE